MSSAANSNRKSTASLSAFSGSAPSATAFSSDATAFEKRSLVRAINVSIRQVHYAAHVPEIHCRRRQSRQRQFCTEYASHKIYHAVQRYSSAISCCPQCQDRYHGTFFSEQRNQIENIGSSPAGRTWKLSSSVAPYMLT